MLPKLTSGENIAPAGGQHCSQEANVKMRLHLVMSSLELLSYWLQVVMS